MKKTLTFIAALCSLTLGSTAALAHTGHLAGSSAHGLLHVEHIVILTAVALIAFFVQQKNK